MNSKKYVFSQLVDFLPQRVFDTIVSRYEGNKYVRHFSCWNQLLCMIFGQLANTDSLRDLIVVLNAHSRKSYHLGLGKSVTRSNLAKANESRNYRVFEDFAYYLIGIAQKKLTDKEFEIKGRIYAFDSSTIDLCLSVFWWATFRRKKAGIKLHTLYDVITQIPAFIHITEAAVNDVNAMDVIPYEAEAYYVFDRGYIDFTRLYRITLRDAWFVVRAKSNLKFNRMYSEKVDRTTGILCDQVGNLSGVHTSKQYPAKLRRVKFYDAETMKTFVFLTNNMDLTSLQIALLYKNRWQVELFFKWIKQHLKIKSFWGTTENAVRIQIYSAIITYCLVTLMGADLKAKQSTYEILQIISVSLLDKMPLNELLTNKDNKNVKEQFSNQLTINWI